MDSRPSLTAEAVCFMRAVDQLSAPEDRVIDDPYAQHFLTPPWRALLKVPPLAWRTLPELTTYIRARHRYMDDRLRDALDPARSAALSAPARSAALSAPTRSAALSAPIEQLVILGAGYDMRGVRLATELSGRPVFEVDYPTTASRKQRVLASLASLAEIDRAHLKYVTLDFQTESVEDVLLSAGFDPRKPTFFTWEGVSMYLSRAAVHATLGALRRLAAPGSALTMDYFRYLDAPTLGASARRFSAGLLAFVAEPVTFPMDPEDVGDFMARDGWRVTDIADSTELRRRYIRDGRAVYPANFVVHAVV